jgi:uncharacterized protein (TIGR02186 family)
MMMRWLLIFLLLPCLAQAEEVVLGLSRDRVAITTSFDGSDILIFGAVKREAPIAEEPLGVVITVAGPSAPVLVRRKSREFGIWVNTDAVEVDLAPSFYVVASTGPIRDVLSNVEDLRHKISIDRAIRSVGAPDTIRDSRNFTNALIRIRRNDDLYQESEGKVVLAEQTLFRTSVKLPANLVEGDYTIRTFLTREGRVVSKHETTIDVRKVGLERWLYTLAQEQAMLYGLMSLAIAALAGWLASAAFVMLRR